MVICLMQYESNELIKNQLKILLISKRKMSSDVPSDFQTNEFLETEYVMYLLPCYYGCIAFVFRYLIVIKEEPKFYLTKIIGENLVKLCEREEQKNRVSEVLVYKVLPASYVIKSKLSLLNSFMYLAMIVLSFISTSAMFYGAKHKPQSFLYIFGFIAWYLSALILRREHQRLMPQSIWIHRIFWMLCGTFSVFKMFEDYFLPINLIINIFFIISNVILAFYGVYRPEDTSTLEMSFNQEIPSFAKAFFQYIEVKIYHICELNDKVRYLLSIQDEEEDVEEEEKQPDPLYDTEPENQEAKKKVKKIKKNNQSVKKQISLLNDLPNRSVWVDKKVRYVKQETTNKFQSQYLIITQIGNKGFQANRTEDEFKAIEAAMCDIFNSRNFQKHAIRKIQDMIQAVNQRPMELRTQNSTGINRAGIYECWLKQAFKTPLFMHRILLDFLNIDDEIKRTPFVVYYDFAYPQQCTDAYLFTMNKNNLVTIDRRSSKAIGYTLNRTSLIGHYQTADVEETINEKMLADINKKLQFSIEIDPDIAGTRSFGYIITCVADKKTKIKWALAKTEEQIITVNQKIEDECGYSVPYFYNSISNINYKSHLSKVQSYRAYLQYLLRNQKYYCPALFIFLKFNPIKMEIELNNFSTYGEPSEKIDRNSNYFSEYGDREQLIWIQRIDRINQNNQHQDIYKFRVRRKGASYSNKTSEQLKKLQIKLADIYKGVSGVPEIDFKNCMHKSDARDKIERFLLKIESLPKVQINRDYLNFYENTLN